MPVKIIATIKEVDNGYLAEINNTLDPPSVVIGSTLSEVLEAIRVTAATRKLQEESPLREPKVWEQMEMDPLKVVGKPFVTTQIPAKKP